MNAYTLTQIIFVCDHYEIATEQNSISPDWPVQDPSGRWHYETFQGQRAVFDPRSVEFGLLARRLDRAEEAALDQDDLPADIYLVDDALYEEAKIIK